MASAKRQRDKGLALERGTAHLKIPQLLSSEILLLDLLGLKII
tara:strand:- start:155 stop:283 length:129 start_codon:yes stop_codon:yes gene_type:complete